MILSNLIIKFFLIFFILIPMTTSVVSAARPGKGINFTLTFINPGASSQATDLGKQIHTLGTFNGRIFSGYGDPNANTGPVYLYAYNPASQSLTEEFTFFSESLEQFQIINDMLYTPAIDPTGGGDIYANRDKTGNWYSDNPIGANHVFDVETLTGSDIYLAGAAGNSATIWRSTDDGQTWQSVLNVPPRSGYSRFYMMFALQGRAYAQAIDSSGGAHPSSWTSTDGVNWQSGGPTLLPNGGWGFDPQRGLGGVIYRSGPSYISGGLYFFDGANVQDLVKNLQTSLGLRKSPGGMGGHTIAPDGSLYVISWKREVFHTSDLVQWKKLGKIKERKAKGTAITVHDGVVYVGLSNSKVYSAPLP